VTPTGAENPTSVAMVVMGQVAGRP